MITRRIIKRTFYFFSIYFFPVICLLSNAASAQETFQYSGYLESDSSRKASLTLTFSGAAVTGNLTLNAVCLSNMRLPGAEFNLHDATVEGQWEGKDSLIRGTWSGSVIWCDKTEPRKGAFILTSGQGPGLIFTATGSYYNRFAFNPLGKIYRPSALSGVPEDVWSLQGPSSLQHPAPANGAPTPASIATGGAIAQAIRFRAAASANFSKALTEYKVGKPLGFITRKPLTRARSEAWSAFFAGSLALIGHAESLQPVIAFYHPLYDAVLVTRWTMKGNTPLMTAADLRVGSMFDKGGDQHPPQRAAWLDEMAGTPAPEVIAGHHDSFLRAFERAFPPAAASLAEVFASANAEKTAAFVEAQALDAIHNVLAIQRVKNPLFNERLRELRKALSRHDKKALTQLIPQHNPTSVGALNVIPTEMLRHLVPSYALISRSDSMVFMEDTFMPRYYMLVFFKQGKKRGRPDIGSLFFFELGTNARRDNR